jgi:hypothetical protein
MAGSLVPSIPTHSERIVELSETTWFGVFRTLGTDVDVRNFQFLVGVEIDLTRIAVASVFLFGMPTGHADSQTVIYTNHVATATMHERTRRSL